MYTTIDPKKASELTITREGWISPDFELKDGFGMSYGKLSYEFLSRRSANLYTADGNFTISFDGLFSRTLIITNDKGEQVGRAARGIFSSEISLIMSNGFEAKFVRSSVWGREYSWEAVLYGPIMRIKSPLFSFINNVYLKQSSAPANRLPFLALLGEYLILLRKRRRAAAH